VKRSGCYFEWVVYQLSRLIRQAASSLVLIMVVNVAYFAVAWIYLAAYRAIYAFEFLSPYLTYIYLLTLPAILVFIISREASGELRFSTQLSIFLCISLTNQFAFADFYAGGGCVLAPNSELSEITESTDDLLYFSFLTFGTLGYGDFTPAGVCRPVAAIQSIFGVMAVAVLISLLSRQSNKQASPDKKI